MKTIEEKIIQIEMIIELCKEQGFALEYLNSLYVELEKLREEYGRH